MKKSKFLKKSLAMLLAVMLVVAMIPLSAAAAEGDPTVYVDNHQATLSGTTYSVEASDTTVNISWDTQTDVTLVVVDKDKEETVVDATGLSVNLTEDATKSGEVYTLGLRTKASQAGDDATVDKDYTLNVTVKEVVESSDATIKALTNPADAKNLDNMTNYTISDDTITIYTAFGKPQVSTLDAKNFVPTNDKVQSIVPNGVKSVLVTAQDGSTKTYTIKLVTDPGFTSFTVPNQTGESEIKAEGTTTNTVSINVPYSTDFTKKIIPTFTVDNAIIAVTSSTAGYDKDVVTSGETEIEFADKTAENFYLWYGKGTNDYQLVTVTLSKPATNPEALLKTIQIVDGDKKSNVVEIAEDATSATVEMPAGYKIADAKNVTVNVTASDNATVSIPSQTGKTGLTMTGVDISGGKIVVRVVSQDTKATTDYTINVTAAASAEAKLNDFTVKGKLNNEDVSYTATWNGLNGTLTIPYSFSADVSGLNVYATASTGATLSTTIENGKTTLDEIFTSYKDGDKVSFKVTASDGNAVTYTLTLKYEAAKTGRTISSAEMTSENNVADITADNTYAVTVGTTAPSDNTQAVNSLRVAVPFSFTNDTTVYLSALTLSDGAKAYIWDSAAQEIKALDSTKSGAQSDTGSIALPTDALDNDGKLIKANAVKVYVLSEQGSVGKTYASEEDLAKAATVYYVYGVKAAAANGNTVNSISSTVDTNVTASMSGKTITVTVPNSYDSSDKFTLNFNLSRLAKLMAGSIELKSDNGSAESTTATKFYVDNGELYADSNSNKVTTSKEATLTVKAENGNINTYTLKLVVADAEKGAELTAVTVNGIRASISGKTVTVNLPFGTNLYPVKLGLTASKMASITIVGVGAYDEDTNYDLNEEIKISVTSEDGATANTYTLKATTADQFSDVDTNDWFYNNVMRAVELGILSGYTDGTFKPMNNITRRDFAIMLAQSLGHDNDEEATSPFKDVADTDYGVSSIAYLYENEITVGDSNGNFNPDANITRQEAAIMLVKAFEATGTSSDLYADDAQIASWAKSFVYTAKAAGLMKGDDHNEFNPTDRLTRAEAASAMVNAVDN